MEKLKEKEIKGVKCLKTVGWNTLKNMPKTPTHDQGYICYGRGVGMATGEINEKRRYIGEKLKMEKRKAWKTP